MGLSIKNDETERLVRELASIRKVGVTQAIQQAVQNELQREKFSPDKNWQRRLADVAKIQQQSKELPVLDCRSDDEILGLGDDGLPN